VKPHEIEFMLTRIGYKPGWTLVYERITGYINVTFRAPDTYDHSKDTDINVPVLVPDGLTEDAFPEWLLDRIFSIERHEAREYFTLDGIHIFDPHPELTLPDFEKRRIAVVLRSKIQDLIAQLDRLGV